MKLKHFLFLGIWSLVIAAPITAQSPTPVSIRDAVQKKVAEELAAIKNEIKKKAYLGTITAKSDATITLITLKKAVKEATVTTDTAIKLSGGIDGTPADLKVGQFVLVMGDADGNGTLIAKRILVISKPTEDKRRAVFGTVTKLTSSTLTLKENWTIKLSSTTKYTGKTKAGDIKVGSKLITVGTVTSDQNLTAKLVHLLQSP
ncbi:MAG: hypothetical protein G01um101416_1139 [Microgenomates group bacterium Gr01-1014_16]|nr:MAG: hypothetical protein G01um101416_1139 [Microgenomates group bacterium Gr01-1014_16]